MPMRVKCRCGQDVVVRYGEWVYALFALLALSLLANTFLCIWFFLRADEAIAPTPPVSQAALTRESGSADVDAGDEEPPAAPRDAPEPHEPMRGSTPPPETVTGVDRIPEADGEESEAPPAGEGVAVWEPPRALVGRDESERPAPDLVTAIGARGASLPEDQESGASATVSRHESRLLVDVAKLGRLLLLETGGGSLGFAYPLLLDPDPLLRTRALARLHDVSADAVDATMRPRLEYLLRQAAELFSEGRAWPQFEKFCLQRFPAVLEVSPAASSAGVAEAFQSAWDDWRAEAVRFLDQPAAKALVDRLGVFETRGLELAFLIDSSESMDAPFRLLRKEMGWCLPALDWAVPGVRGGLLLYADGIRGAQTLESGLAERLLGALEEAEVHGGGDVPEDLHLAVREALSLGRFAWEVGAEKHLLVVGDAPPPYLEMRRLVLLLEQAHTQTGVRLHMLGVAPHEQRAEVPFFSELAEAGGGCSHTLSGGEIGREVFVCILGVSAADVVAPLFAALRQMFAESTLENR